jgi:hypothetical protein
VMLAQKNPRPRAAGGLSLSYEPLIRIKFCNHLR